MSKSKFHRQYLSICVCVAATVATVAQAGETPTLGDLVSEILKASAPVRPYRVSVVQTVDQNPANATPSPSAASAQTTEKAKPVHIRSGYMLHYTPDKGIRTEAASQAAAVKTSSSAMPPADARLSINVPNFLRKIQTWPTNSIAKDLLGGKACFKVSASTPDANVVFWADATNHCVLRVEAYIRGHPFAESTFEYQPDVNNGWLLSHVETSYAGDGSQVLLDYGAYDFSAK